MNKALFTDIRREAKNFRLKVSVGDGWINIRRPDGVHCEFYTCYGDSSRLDEVVTATYVLNGEVQELDFYLPEEISEFVNVCAQILTEPEGEMPNV